VLNFKVCQLIDKLSSSDDYMCVIHDRRLQRRAINRPAGSSSRWSRLSW